MASFGEKLRHEREMRGVSLREIADGTKISVRFLQALEEGRLDVLPGGLFPRAFVRQYANFLGLDAEQAGQPSSRSRTARPPSERRAARAGRDATAAASRPGQALLRARRRSLLVVLALRRTGGEPDRRAPGRRRPRRRWRRARRAADRPRLSLADARRGRGGARGTARAHDDRAAGVLGRGARGRHDRRQPRARRGRVADARGPRRDRALGRQRRRAAACGSTTARRCRSAAAARCARTS